MSGRLFFNNVEPQVHNVYDLFLKPGCVFFDVGANVGLHSYYVSRKFNGAKVYAFEPLPANAAYIRSAIKLNHISNISLYEEAVSDKPGTAFFDQSVNNHQGRLSKTNDGIQVTITSLDVFITEKNIKPDFIKIDVEGAESLVMDGFKNCIRNMQPVMIIEVHEIDQSDKLLAYFRPINYKLCRLHYPFVKGNGKYFSDISMNDKKENIVGQLVAIPNEQYPGYAKYMC